MKYALTPIKLGDVLGDECFQNGIYKHADSYGTGTPILRINNFDNLGRVMPTTLSRVGLSAAERQQFSVRENDILINRVNSLSHVGKSMLVPLLEENPVFESNIMRIRIGNGSQLVPEYVAAVLQAESTRRFLKKVAKAAIAQVSINQDDVRSVRIFLYPIEVQKRTADALAEWNTATEKTEQLIAAKEDRFLALIDRLVLKPASGKVWKTQKLRDIATRVQRRSDGGGHPVLTISNASGFVLQEEKYKRYMAGESVKDYILLRRGEFAYNKGNSLRFQFGCVYQLHTYDEAIVPHVYVCFRLHDDISSSYLRHLFAVDYLKP